MAIVIRQTKDLQLVQWMHRQCFPHDEWDERGTHWVAWVDGYSAGFCSARPLYGESGCFFCWAGVLKWARGHGLQRRLIRARLKWAKRHYSYALTYVSPDNYASLANLIKCGFQIYDPDWRWAGSVIYLQHDLRARRIG